jgi:hypothetical protein
MNDTTIAPIEQDREIWQSLQAAISNSSGFKRWQLQQVNESVNSDFSSLEVRVRLYLKETLATLAY